MAGKAIPTVQVSKPGVGRIVVNHTDLKRYEAEGYKLVTEDDTTPTPAATTTKPQS